ASSMHPLITDAPALGCFDQAVYTPSSVLIPPKARLLVFSDGVFEIFQGSEKVGSWSDYLKGFSTKEIQDLRPSERLDRALKQRGASILEDDFSFMEFRFN